MTDTGGEAMESNARRGRNRYLSGVERVLDEDDVIVSKTDTKGIITYANGTFCRYAGYEMHELIGVNHNVIRHPDMPGCIFRLLWQTIAAGNELFAFVNNRSRNGDNYWVLAHVTPTFAEDGTITGYNSFRRKPDRPVLSRVVIPLYAELLREERRHERYKEGVSAAQQMLVRLLEERGTNYLEWILSLQ